MLKEISADELLGLAMLYASKEFYVRAVLRGTEVIELNRIIDGRMQYWDSADSEFMDYQLGDGKDSGIEILQYLIKGDFSSCEAYSGNLQEFKGFYVLCN